MLRVVVYDKKVMLWLISPLKKAFFPHFYFVWLLSLEVNQYVPILALLHRFPAEVKCCCAAASVMRGETLQEQGEIRRFTIRREREKKKKKKQSKLKLHFCWSKRFFFSLMLLYSMMKNVIFELCCWIERGDLYNFFYIGKQRKSTHDAVAEGPIMSTFCIKYGYQQPAKK